MLLDRQYGMVVLLALVTLASSPMACSTLRCWPDVEDSCHAVRTLAAAGDLAAREAPDAGELVAVTPVDSDVGDAGDLAAREAPGAGELVAATPAAFIGSTEASPPDAGVSLGEAPPVELQGPLFKAASVAAADLMARRAQSAANAPVVLDSMRCLGRIESYDITVHPQNDRYLVYIRPVAGRCVRGHLKGGDATYEISKADFRILRKDYGQ